jgi:uncharacterized Zn finger protein
MTFRPSGFPTQPVLTPAAVEAFVGAREVQKGRSYVDDLDDLSSQPVSTGLLLRGVAHGQESYMVQATLSVGDVHNDVNEEARVLGGRCSCPVGNRCKHVASLLTRYVKRPDDFQKLLPLAEALARLNTAQLHGLIEQMLLAAPELQELVQRAGNKAATGATQTGSAKSIPALFLKIKRVYHSGWQYGEEGLDTGELEDVLGEADALQEMQPEEALAVYLQMIQSAETAYETWAEADDEPFDGLLAEATTGLLALVSGGHLSGNRRSSAVAAVMQLENPVFLASSDSLGNFAQALSDSERAALQTLLQKTHDGASEHYRRPYAQALIAIIPASQQTPAVRERLVLESQNPRQIAEFYLSSNTAEAREKLVDYFAGNRWRLDELFGLFGDHSAEDLLEQVLVRRGNSFGGLNAEQHWLFDRYRATGRTRQAADLARAGLLASAGLGWEKLLRQISSDWPGEWKTLFRTLQVQPQLRNQVLHLLLTGDHPTGEAQDFDRQHAATLNPELRLTLAQRLAASPATLNRAAEIQLEVAQRLISERGRRNYARAADLLGSLTAWLGQEEGKRRIAAVVRVNSKLPSFLDELRRAGLL